MAAYQYVYVLKGLVKTYPGGREVLKDIWLSFLPVAISPEKKRAAAAERSAKADGTWVPPDDPLAADASQPAT